MAEAQPKPEPRHGRAPTLFLSAQVGRRKCFNFGAVVERVVDQVHQAVNLWDCQAVTADSTTQYSVRLSENLRDRLPVDSSDLHRCECDAAESVAGCEVAE